MEFLMNSREWWNWIFSLGPLIFSGFVILLVLVINIKQRAPSRKLYFKVAIIINAIVYLLSTPFLTLATVDEVLIFWNKLTNETVISWFWDLIPYISHKTQYFFTYYFVYIILSPIALFFLGIGVFVILPWPKK